MNRTPNINPNHTGLLTPPTGQSRPVEVRKGAGLRPQGQGIDVAAAWGKALDRVGSIAVTSSQSHISLTQESGNRPNSFATAPTDLDEIPQIPPWISSVADLSGRINIARINPCKLPFLVEHLADPSVRVDYFWPQQAVVRYGRSAKRWQRSLFAGTVFIAGDTAGWDEAYEYAKHCDWMITWLRPSDAGQERLLCELADLEKTLRVDPTLSALSGIKAGVRCRIKSGALEGVTGIVSKELPKGIMQVTVSTLGQYVPVDVAREMLEPV